MNSHPFDLTPFSLKIFSALASGQTENIFLSPLSVAAALTMTLNGAKGNTYAEMVKTLELQSLDLDNLNDAFSSLLARLKEADLDIEFSTASGIWSRRDAAMFPTFIHRVSKAFHAQASNLDFTEPGSAEVINGWVKEATRERIDNLVSPEDIFPALVVLVSAVFFKGKWTTPFDPQLTLPTDFHCQDGSIKTISMLTQTQEMEYFEDEDKQAVRLSYGKDHFSMLILLPRPTVPLENITSSLTMQQWSVIDALMHQEKVKLSIPRFRLEYKAELRPALAALGMPSAFSGQSDFSAMASVSLKISTVIHKACLEVNEKGSEAAAATAVMMKRAIPIPDKQMTMKVDRPFLVAIMDNETKLPIFLGAVYNLVNI